jgi:FkbM family methyltransferase
MTKLSYRLKLWKLRRILALKLRGRIRHHDRFGLSYWLWKNTRALAIPHNHPATDDAGVFEQITRIYEATSKTDTRTISIDVGAYIGIISLAMAKYGPANHEVHSFEADDVNYAMFNDNLSSNQPHSIHPHQTAVGSEIGTAQFTRTSDTGTNHLGVQDDSTDLGAVVFDVPITTLDSFAEQHDFDVVRLLKIDAEGADINVLRGASSLLNDKRIEAIIVEVPLTADTRSEMIEFLKSHGMITAYIQRNSDQLEPSNEEIYNGSVRAPLNMLAVRTDLESLLLR